MKKVIASIAGGLIALAGAGSASASQGLLDLDLIKPLSLYNSTGVTTYNAATDRFTVTATLLATQIDGVEVYLPLGSASVTMSFKVNRMGRLTGGVAGPDLVIEGSADLDDDGIPEYSGVLLQGEIVGFGWMEAGTTDLFDTKFKLIGGSMAGLYGKHIGVTITVENSTFNGTFCYDFGGGAKGNIGTVGGDDCPRSAQSWKNDRCDWPTDTLTIGGVEYNAAQLYNILRGKYPNGSACRNDPLVELAQCLVAAKLSILDGAVVDEEIVLAIAAADTFLASRPFGSELDTEESDLAGALTDAVCDYLTDTSACGRSHGCKNRRVPPKCKRYKSHCGWGHHSGGGYSGGGCR